MPVLLVVLMVMMAACLAGLFVIWRKLQDMAPMAVMDPDLSGTITEIVDALHLASRLAAGVATELEVNVAEARQQFSRLVVLLDNLQMDVTAGGAADAVVAGNLKALQKQARDMKPSPPGTVADAAAGGGAPSKPKT